MSLGVKLGNHVVAHHCVFHNSDNIRHGNTLKGIERNKYQILGSDEF